MTALLPLALALSHPAVAATFTVDDLGDTADLAPGDGACADAYAACTLRAAVEEANALPGRDAVLMGVGTVRLALGPLTVTDDLDLSGLDRASSAISAEGADRVLLVDAPGTVALNDLTLRQGAAPPGEAGGCMWSGSDVAFTGVRWQSCTAENGGALASEGSTTIIGSVATDNTAVEEGGAFWLAGPATITQTQFARNDGEDGAAVAFRPSDLSNALDLLDCTFRENYSRYYAVVAATGPASIASSRFVDNDVGFSVVQWGSELLQASDVTAVRSGRYGAVFSYGHLTVTDVVADAPLGASAAGATVDVANSWVGTDDDIALFIEYASDVTLHNLTLRGARWPLVLTQNERNYVENLTVFGVDDAAHIGGGHTEIVASMLRRGLIAQLEAEVTLRDVDVIGDSGDGASIWVEAGSSLTLEDSRVRDNAHDDCWYCWVDFGGALLNEGHTTARNTRFVGNYASNRGGALYNVGTFVAEDCSFDRNTSMAGGAIYNEGGELDLTRVTFAGNIADEGGAIVMDGGTLTVHDSLFHHNAAAYAFAGQGGAVLGHGDGLIRNTTFLANYATHDGAALALSGPGSLLLDQVTVAYNHADGDADGVGLGALWVGDEQELVLHNALVAHNADSADGVACVRAGSGTIVSDGGNLADVGCGVFTAPADQEGTPAAPLDPLLVQSTADDGLRVATPTAGSPAIDAALDCTPTDQLGRPRPTDGDGDGVPACDIGALEVP